MTRALLDFSNETREANTSVSYCLLIICLLFLLEHDDQFYLVSRGLDVDASLGECGLHSDKEGTF